MPIEVKEGHWYSTSYGQAVRLLIAIGGDSMPDDHCAWLAFSNTATSQGKIDCWDSGLLDGFRRWAKREVVPTWVPKE
jgi:hypothetical protein